MNDLKKADINIKEAIIFLFKNKKPIVLITSIFALSSVIYSLSIPNFYESRVLLAPAQPNDSLSSKIGGYASLAATAGINIPTESYDKSSEAIERIKSYDFFVKHILPYIKIQDLIAETGWNASNNTLIYDEKLFDSKKEVWIRKVKDINKTIPSAQEAYREFQKIITVSQDIKTGFYTITLEHISPNVAKEWIELIVNNINESMRDIDREDASNSIDFLNSRLNETFYSEIKIALSQLIQEQTQKLMLAESNKFYIFKLLDSPIAPEIKSGPSRALICIFGTFLGFLISLFAVAVNFYRKNNLL